MPIKDFRGEYAFLSNFSPCAVRLGDLTFQSTEAAYQAAKTLNLEDRKPFTLMGPGQAKKAGQKLSLRADWEDVRLAVMEDLLRQKFEAESYKQRLLMTGEEELVEGNYWQDRFWGVCNGVGENHLGKFLMKIRCEIKECAK